MKLNEPRLSCSLLTSHIYCHEIFDKFHNKSYLKTFNVSDKLGSIRQISELNKVNLTQQIQYVVTVVYQMVCLHPEILKLSL